MLLAFAILSWLFLFVSVTGVRLLATTSVVCDKVGSFRTIVGTFYKERRERVSDIELPSCLIVALRVSL